MENSMENICVLHSQRAAGLVQDTAYSKYIKNSAYLVKRLKRTNTITGHTGCVNTISWNESGDKLLSGSDDCHLNLYDTARGLMYKRVHTSHQSNIFSAKFLPWSNDLRAVSCAGVGTVEFSEITPGGEYVGHRFQCHTSLTYQVATSPSNSDEFMTCEEKGYVRLFDLRKKSSCHCSGCTEDVLFDFPSAVSSMSVHPLSPHYIAFGLGDGSIKLIDRRKVGVGQSPVGDMKPPELALTATHHKYRPSALGSNPHKITSVQFNQVGSELLASYSDDYVYLFNSGLFGIGGSSPPVAIKKPLYYFEQYSPMIGRKRRDSMRHKPHPLQNNLSQSKPPPIGRPVPAPGPNEEPPPVKKFRLRGDWSDTGPNARPDGTAGPLEPRREGLSNTLINRMSRMFAQWIDMSLSPEEEGGASDGHARIGERRNDAVEVSLSSSSSSDSSSFNLVDSGNEDERRSETNSITLSAESADHLAANNCAGSSNSNIAVSAVISHDIEGRGVTLDLAEDSNVRIEPTESSSGFQRERVESIHRACSSQGVCGVSRSGNLSLTEDSSSEGRNSTIPTPFINIIEGETDSDDDQSHDHIHQSHDQRQTESTNENVGQQLDQRVLDNTAEHTEDEFRDCLQPFMVYKGHRNSRTMIKQANFLGDNWIVSGSDCGRVFVWDKWTGRVENVFDGDSHVVNCIQPHPYAYILATSGIDYDIKIWEPFADTACCLDNVEDVIQRNEMMLQESRNTVTVPSIFVLRILAYLNRRRRMHRGHAHWQNDEPSEN